jgi:hypothetical protein
MLRHVAKIAHTDQRIVVAFMQIPQRLDHALVIPTDNLPPRYEQAVMDVLHSPEGQNEECLAVALSRRLMPDSGKDIFSTLHDMKLLQPEPVTSILMMPLPNQPVKLTDILTQLGRMPNANGRAVSEAEMTKFNPHLNNQVAGDAEQRRGVARGLLIQADILEAEGRDKRELAYRNDPSLRPQTHIQAPVKLTPGTELLAESEHDAI